MQQRIPRRDPLRRVELQARFQQVHKANELLELVVLHLDRQARGRVVARAQVARRRGDVERLERVLHQSAAGHPFPRRHGEART